MPLNRNSALPAPAVISINPIRWRSTRYAVSQQKESGLSAKRLICIEGKGEMQIVIDEEADEAQRAALETVLSGGETKEAATHWWVFHAMSDTKHRTLYKPIELEVDLEARRAKARIPGVLESTGSPIRPPHSDGEHRARIVIPNGIEYEEAEMGRGVAKTGGDMVIELDLENTYAQFSTLRHAGAGVVHA